MFKEIILCMRFFFFLPAKRNLPRHLTSEGG